MSFEQPITTAEITGVGALNLLEAIRVVDPAIRFYQASTSEMFGKVQAAPQSESTPFTPAALMGSPNCLHTGRRSTIGSLTVSLARPAFCSITNLPLEG